MIYIDPPYNTGKDFVYKDNFTQDSDEYKKVAKPTNTTAASSPTPTPRAATIPIG